MKLRGLCLLCLLLVSCTGTFEVEPPVFVIAGVINDGQAELVLLEDRYRFINDTDSRARFTFFDRIELLAPAIAFDIVDRVNTRSELIVLTRDDDTSYLQFFSLLGIETPADFEETTTKQINLAELTDLPEDLDICPTHIQVTRDGNFGAILNDPETCDLTGETQIILVDLEDETFLSAFGDINFRISPVNLIIDQNNDALYFLRNRATSVNLAKLDRANFRNESPDDNVTYASDENNRSDIQRSLDQTDVMRFGSSYAILNPRNAGNSVYTIAPFSSTATFTNVPTLTNAQSFIPDYTNQYNQVFILSNNRIAIHQNPETTTSPNRIEGSTTATLGTINTFTDFLYLALDNTLQVFDLLELQDSPGSIVLQTETDDDNAALEKLNDPSILTWVQGIGTETVP
jgi:hypothetical protein